MLIRCLAVGAGGFLGSVFRYLISLIPFLHRDILPLQTLLVNAAGAIMIGIIVEASQLDHMSENTVLFLKVGICGGFTTFSTFALESVNIMEDGKGLISFLYIAASIVLCLAGVYLGRWIAGYFGA